MALLEIARLSAFHGKSRVLRGVDLLVSEGEIVSLLGRNGAGRSSLLKAVIGQLPASGTVSFKGQEISGLKPFEIARRGLGYVPESRDVFPSLSVEQNLLLGMQKGRAPRWSVEELFRMLPLLEQRRHAPAGVLSGGEQQLLALCRTLMGGPDLIMIDEPTEGLAPAMVQLVAGMLKELQAAGMAVLLVEQKLQIALEISRRIYVMGRGEIVFEGEPDALHNNLDVRREWLEI
jgi:branched-chain amino acid transport system ATP-binding protein